MTVFGAFWIVLCVLSFFSAYKYTFFLLLLSCVFQAAAVANFGGKGITPLFFTELILIIRCLFIHQETKFKLTKQVKYLFFFTVFTVVITFIYPFLFRGIHVYSQKLGGIDPNFFAGGSPLVFSSSNFAQILFLVINFITFFLVVNNSFRISKHFLWRSILFIIAIVLFFGFWEYFSKSTGLNIYPFSVFNSNEGYPQLYGWESNGRYRLSATFVEPSMAGAFLAPSFWALYAVNTFKTKVLSFVVLLALALNMSGTGLGTFICGFLIYIYFKGGTKVFRIGLFAGLLVVLLLMFGFLDFIISMVGGKFEDDASGFVRLGADLFTLLLLLDTYGLGVGLGSHRTSGFLINILGGVGILGTILFYLFVSKSLSHAFKNMNFNNNALFVSFFAISLFVAQFLAIPDLTFPVMWFWIFILSSCVFTDETNTLQNL